MKLFDDATNADVSEEECAALVLEIPPLTMGIIKAEMRKHHPEDMTLSQFRTLMFIQRRAGASLSDVAEFLDLTLSTTSKLVDGLVKRRFITREAAADDRRKVLLMTTEMGEDTLQEAHRRAQALMVKALTGLTAAERVTVKQAMHALHRVLKNNPNTEPRR